MPTSRRRYQVTESAEVGRALDRAAERWPGEERSRLLLHVIETGAAHIDKGSVSVAEARRSAIRLAASGVWDDAFGPDYLSELRKDWRE